MSEAQWYHHVCVFYALLMLPGHKLDQPPTMGRTYFRVSTNHFWVNASHFRVSTNHFQMAL